MNQPYPSLFRPGRIGNVELKNRIVKAPQTTGFANPDGSVSERTIRHYQRLAEGGAGLIIVEYTYIDEIASKSIHCQLGISSADHVSGLGRLVDVVHAHGAKVALQIEHCGRQKFLGTPPIKAPSAIPWPLLYEQTGLVPEILTIDEIREIVSAFGDAARRAWQAGFDLVELHGAHGYLITGFLSPHTNTRADLYGGPLANRQRFLLEILRDIRSKVPPDFPISVRLSGTDYEPGGLTVEETVQVCAAVEEAGIAAIHVSGGDHHTMEWQVSPQLIPTGVHAPAARAIKDSVAVPVIVSGSITTPELADRLLRDGAGDFVGLGRPLLADPFWPSKAARGDATSIRPCIRCNEGCLDRGLMQQRGVGCSVNPTLGHEEVLDLTRTVTPRRVAVLGSGPGALEAASLLARKGHHVKLHASLPLGGGLRAAAAASFQHDLGVLLTHLIHELEVSGVELRDPLPPNDAEALEGADVVVLATGRTPAPFALPVANQKILLSARDALLDGADGASSVVVVGGGATGVYVALHLAQQGVAVTLVERSAALLAGAPATDLMTFPPALADHGVVVLTATDAVELTETGVILDGPDGRRELATDRVVPAVGWVTERTDVDALAAPGRDLHVMGTASARRTLHDVMHDAHRLAMQI